MANVSRLTALFLLWLAQPPIHTQELSPHKVDYQRLKEFLQYRQLSAVSTAGTNVDVTYYSLDIQLNPAAQSIVGSVRIVCRVAEPGISSISMNLNPALIIDSVLVEGNTVPVSRDVSVFTMPVSPPAAIGSLLTLDVFYNGSPSASGFGSITFSQQPNTTIPWIWTLSEPYGAHDWWPCKDSPDDKADSIDIRITCDQSLEVASQGKLVSVTPAGPGKVTYHWEHRYPIATYLVSIAVTDYTVVSDWFYFGPADSMEVVDYVLPASAASTLPQLARAVPMLGIFSDLFGLYPFAAEKYGHAQFGWGGGMEHQTMTSLGSFSEEIVAHELAHQWFGDMITMRTWGDIWLNEGFATYAVALYKEAYYGPPSYRNAMNFELDRARFAVGSLFVTDTTNLSVLFNGSLVYSKGAAVLHMLRHVVGDSAFFAALKSYAATPQFRFSNASTRDLQDVFERVSGMNLGYFFDQWIFGERHPRYTYTWNWSPLGTGASVEFSLLQTTGVSIPSVFQMPIDIRVSGSGGDTTIVVFNNAVEQQWTWTLPFVPVSVVLDPDDWILKSAAEINPLPVTYELGLPYPNPFNGSVALEYFVPERSRVTLEIVNMLGQVVDVVEVADRDRGYYAARWTPTTASGVYACRLSAVPTGPPRDVHQRVRKVVYIK